MTINNKIIPINRLRDECIKDTQVKRFCQGQEWHYLTELPIHRDDCYLFILLEQGSGSMNIDFKEIRLDESGLCIVCPGQIHYNIRGENVAGWLLRIDGTCMSDDCSKMLEDILLQTNAYTIPEGVKGDCISIIKMLDKCLAGVSDFPLKNKIASSLLNTFLDYVVSIGMMNLSESISYNSRQEQICSEFKKLLRSNVILSKSPSFYAERLCISESYLNEVIKRNTGFNVSWWIRDRVILEAKRLLSFTDQTVLQVAYALGYDDHIYFSKLFKQHTGVTPSMFRMDYYK